VNGVTYLAPLVGIVLACAMLAVARASYYRSLTARVVSPRPSPPRTLSGGERGQVLEALHEPRFVDLAPAEVYATLLDEGRYLCSERTMYRILAANSEVRDTTSFGVLKLNLLATSYQWQFLPDAQSGNGKFTDTGSGNCH